MIIPTIRRATGATMVLGVLFAVYAATFFFGALLHVGVRVPLGFTVLAEPRILPATVVEGLCGLTLSAASFAALTRKGWARPAAIAAHAFALGGVLLGTAALAIGAGPTTDLNTVYHRVMLVALAAALALLLTPTGRAALPGTDRTSRRETAE